MIKAKTYLPMFAITLVGQIVTFAIQLIIARRFGASATLDGYLAGLAIPQFLLLIFNTGLSTTLLPGYYAKPAAERARFLGDLLVAVSFGGALLVAVGVASAPFVFRVTFSDLPAETTAIGIYVCRLGFLTVLTGVLINLLSSIYYTREQFVFAGLAPVLGQGVNLLLVWLLYGLGIHALIFSFLAAQVFQVTFLSRAAKGLDLGLGRRNPFSNPGVVALAVAALPILASTVFSKSTGLVDRYLGGMAAAGAAGVISHLDYAYKIAAAIAGLTTNVLPNLVYPAIAAAAAERDYTTFNRIVSEGVFFAAVLSTPIVAIGSFFTGELVQLLLQRGEFSAEDTAAVAALLQIYLVSLWPRGMGGVTGNALYALKAVRWVAILGSVEAVLYVFYSYWLTRRYGAIGVPIGFVTYFMLSLTWAAGLLRYKTRGAMRVLFTPLSDYYKLAAAGVVTAGVCCLVRLGFNPGWLRVLLGAAAGLGCYVAVCHWLRIELVTKSVARLATIIGNGSTALPENPSG
jgi:putative peptidoglycan lipid II flippase